MMKMGEGGQLVQSKNGVGGFFLLLLYSSFLPFQLIFTTLPSKETKERKMRVLGGNFTQSRANPTCFGFFLRIKALKGH